VLTGGRPTSDPIAALTSERMRQLVQEARNTFDWVILDTPPVALITDASLVSSMTDGAADHRESGANTVGPGRTRRAGGRPRADNRRRSESSDRPVTVDGDYDYYDYYSVPVAQ
jgi:hypothetical protein